MSAARRLIGVLLLMGTPACTKEIVDGQDVPPWQSEHPDDVPDRTVPPYTGNHPITLDAQARFYTGNDLHSKVIRRSCSGTGGVCHNQKEYPDMRTAESFLAMTSAPCNVNAKFYGAIFDRCEQPGDLFSFDDEAKHEIAYVEYVPGELADDVTPDATSPGLHIVLRDALPSGDNPRWRSGIFTRRLLHDGVIDEQAFAEHSTQWWLLAPNRLLGVVRDYQTESIAALLQAGLRQGDGNRNGVFGADVDPIVSLLNPGLPEESYLVGRLLGTMKGVPVPGTRMPLANLPPTTPEMLALACFIEGLPRDGTRASMAWPINYATCSFRESPEALGLTGTGVTWTARIQPLLAANCGGCHGGSLPSAGLDLTAPNAHARLLGPSGQVPSLSFVTPGNPGASYLWLKLTNDASIVGDPMPQDPQLGFRSLAPEELADIQTWITTGALAD